MYTPVCLRLCLPRFPTDANRDGGSALGISGILWFCDTTMRRVYEQWGR
jgi:hypothetical protein